MTRYDQLRAGLSPVQAMREVVPLIVVEQQHATARELFAPMLDSASAADLATTSYPSPLAAARPGHSPQPQDLAVLGAALELGREADTERQPVRVAAVTADDVSTPSVDERHHGLNQAQVYVGHAGADQATSTALLGQADSSRAGATAGAPATATAARSYPTPIKEVTAAQAAPKAAPTTRTAHIAVPKARAARRQH